MFLGGVAGIDGEPRVEVMAGVAFAALEHLGAFANGLVIDLRFGGPAAGEPGELITFAGRQVPGAGLGALHCKRMSGFVLDGSVAAQNPELGIHAIMQGHFDIVANILQHDVEIVLLDAMGDVAKDQVAIAVLACNFERWLVIARPTPAGKLFIFQHLVRVEGRDIAAGRDRRKIVHTPQGRPPIEIAERAIGVNSHGVGTLAGSQQPGFAAFHELHGLGAERCGGQERNRGQK